MLSVLTNGEEVHRRAQTKGDQNQRIEKNLIVLSVLTNGEEATCWNCGEKGHFRIDCTRPKSNHNHKSGDDDDSINSAEDIGDALILSVGSLIGS